MEIRAERPQLPLKVLLNKLHLNRKTYYDNRSHRLNRLDKYAAVKGVIKSIFYQESDETYGYRRMHGALLDQGFSYAPNTVRKLMRQLGLKTRVYSRRTARYSSYAGPAGVIKENILKQRFNETRPYHVLHTDITEYKLTTGKKVYISPVIDEASLEILACQVSYSPNMRLVYDMLAELKQKLPETAQPILHSDQGFQYRHYGYQTKLRQMKIKQSMSRKGNCHDNAPGETIFNLMKREKLNRIKISSLAEMREVLHDYVYWFNHIRRSNKLKYTTPIKYRNRALSLA